MLAAVKARLEQREAEAIAFYKVVVAVKAEKSLSNSALAWALTHVVRPRDCILLLAVLPSEKSGKRFWNFPRLTGGDCGNGQEESLPDRILEISESCSQMVHQFHDRNEVKVTIKVVSDTLGGAVAAEAREYKANWVILDKKLKQEIKNCLEELHCNIVMMKGTQAKVLRLNLGCQTDPETPFLSALSSPNIDVGSSQGQNMKHSTPVSSPEEPKSCCARTTSEEFWWSNEDMATPFLLYDKNPLFDGLNKEHYISSYKPREVNEQYTEKGSDMERLLTAREQQSTTEDCNHKRNFWVSPDHPSQQSRNNRHCGTTNQNRFQGRRTLFDKFVQYDQEMKATRLSPTKCHQRVNSDALSIRDAVSLGRTSSVPPPLCSICQHKAPVFGKPPRRFNFEELEEATNGFSDENFLAKGGFGLVYRGVLRDGRVVAVKQLQFTGSEADSDFCREVQILSCAQHRNIVLLAGFCVEGNKRLLVYEYICNDSLDFHLHGSKENPLDWHSRHKIAIGVARGLRYLHEDCRLGCIVHRDMRPNNILLTHDHEPLIADFGLARWLCEAEITFNQRVIGISGYLAPEYVNGGIITEKIDVYAFGMILLELMTGQKAIELQACKRQNVLSDFFHPLVSIEPNHFLMSNYGLLDPSLSSDRFCSLDYQLQAMIRAASLCVQRDPDSRPPMSKILRILEGDLMVPLALDLNSAGNRSGHMRGLISDKKVEARLSHTRRLSH